MTLKEWRLRRQLRELALLTVGYGLVVVWGVWALFRVGPDLVQAITRCVA